MVPLLVAALACGWLGAGPAAAAPTAGQTCCFGCRPQGRDPAVLAALQQIAQNQQTIIGLLQQPRPPAPPSIIVLNPPLPRQDMPLGGAPRQEIPLGGAPKQDIPLGAAPKQDMPLGGAPKQDIPLGVPPKQAVPLSPPSLERMPPADKAGAAQLRRYRVSGRR